MNTFKNIFFTALAAIAVTATPVVTVSNNTSNAVILAWGRACSYAYPPVTTLNANDSLTFVFPGETHNVYQFPNRAAYNYCDFSNATEVSDSGPVSINVTEGITYFGCSIGSHCTVLGVKVAVIAV